MSKAMTGSEHCGSPKYMRAALLSALLLVFGPTHATSPEFSVAGNDGDVFVEDDMETTLDEYLASKGPDGWDRGENFKRGGSPFFVAIGVGEISAPIDHPRYMASRANAFDKAFLNAKAEMVKHIGESISKDLESAYQEGQSSPNPGAAADTGSAKIENMLLSALSRALGEPQDAPKAASPSAVAEAISSEQFKKSVASVARSRVVGMQTFKVFESKNREIGVVAIWSPKLQAMADAVYRNDPSQVPEGAPKKPLKAQIPKDAGVLMTTFGVTMTRDENGQLALIAYGQGIPISDRTRAQHAAYEKARLIATGELRSFLGEVISIEGDIEQSESVEDFADRTSEYEYNESYKETMASHASAHTIRGIKTLRKWKAVHPLSGRKVMGVIVAWTPDSARGAQRLQSAMTAPAATAKQADKNRSWDDKKAWAGTSSQGAEGDEESF
jgi:hypothetical protein